MTTVGGDTSRVESGTTYTQNFNAENMMTSVVTGGQTTFVYDGDNSLVKKINPNGTYTVYIGGLYEVEYSAGNAVTKKTSYYPGGAMRVDVVGGSNTLYYLLKDHLGSASTLLDTNGNIVANGEQRYYPFGEKRLTSADLKTAHLFTGQLEVGLGGIYNYGARMYSPRLGRFLSADMMVPNWKNPQTLNRYSYTHNNPLKYTDSSGHCVDGVTTIPCVLAAVSALVVAPAALVTGADYLAQTYLAGHTEYEGMGCYDASCGGGFFGYMRDRGLTVFGVSAGVNTVTAGLSSAIAPALPAVATAMGMPAKTGGQILGVGVDAVLGGSGNVAQGAILSASTKGEYTAANAAFDFTTGFTFQGSSSWMARGSKKWLQVLANYDEPDKAVGVALAYALAGTGKAASGIANTQTLWDGSIGQSLIPPLSTLPTLSPTIRLPTPTSPSTSIPRRPARAGYANYE